MIENYTCECGHTADKHVEVGCVADRGQGICSCLETPKSIGNILLLATVTAQRDALLVAMREIKEMGSDTSDCESWQDYSRIVESIVDTARAAISAAESDGAK